MTTLALDLSPILVNRTAVYTLCLDVDETMRRRDAAIDYQFIGQSYASIPPADEQQRLHNRLTSAIEIMAQTRPGAHDWEADDTAIAAADAGERRTLYLDPLYTLFAPIGPNDIVVCHDLSPLTHPYWHNPMVSRLYERAFRKIVRSDCVIIADSDNTADTFRANFGGVARRVRTIHLYLPKSTMAAREAAHAAPLTAPYFLFVGSLEARKNIVGAIEAFRLSGLAETGFKLLVVGQRAHGAEAVERLAAATKGVVLAGFLSEADKHAAYVGATGFVYPSYLEGFGIPLLEAMAFGVPSVASLTGACPEVGGPDVPCLDPDDHYGFAQAMRRIAGLSKSARSRVSARLRKRVDMLFSFDRYTRDIESVVFG